MVPAQLGATVVVRCSGEDQVSFHFGEAAEDSDHESPDNGRGVGPQLSQRHELPFGVHDLPDDGKQVEGRARQAADLLHPYWDHRIHPVKTAGMFIAHWVLP